MHIKRLFCIVASYLYVNIVQLASCGRPAPGCKQPINIYSDLKCKPSIDQGPQSCPACYDCSQINPKINKCYYRGKYYDIGTTIDGCEPLPSCYKSCVCNEDLTFTCSFLDCEYPTIPDNCYYTYDANGCCPTGYKCPGNDTFVCHADGYDVREGETYQNPKDPCSTCTCTKGTTGGPGDPNCKKNVCDVELYAANNILDYCAAVYSQLTECCPNQYICPSDDDNFLDFGSSLSLSSSGTSESIDPVGPRVKCDDRKGCQQCRYGKHCYRIGTKFTRTEIIHWPIGELHQTTSCECTIPPYFTCTRPYLLFPLEPVTN